MQLIRISLTWVLKPRIADFIQHQNAIASKVATSTALEISTYIQNRRDLLGVLNKPYLRELIELNKGPSNTIISLVDAACYMAKDLGRNQFYIYDDDDSIFEEKRYVPCRDGSVRD